MLLLFPSRYRHFVLIALGVALLVFGLVAASTGAAIIGGVLLVWGLFRTTCVLRGAGRPSNTHSNEVGR